jgi:hypothetical protein
MKKLILPALTACTLLLASCGSDSNASGPPILSITNSAISTNPALSSPQVGSEDKMMWAGRQNFTVKGELSALDSDAASYVISPSRVSKSDLNSLRKVFAIEDDFVAQKDNMGGGYLSGDYKTGNTPMMYVSSDAMQYWNYQAPWSDASTSVGCSSPGGNTSDVLPCAVPTPPENVPTASQAEDLFKQMLKDLGLSHRDFVIESYASEWGAGASGYLTIDGVRSSLSWSASYGADAELLWASGVLADITKGANYPRIGTTQGIARLNSEQNWGGPLVRGDAAHSDMSVKSQSSTKSSAPSAPPVPADDTSDASVTKPVTPDDTVVSSSDTQEMPVIEIEIVSVEEELVSLYGSDGSIYLVPGYAFLAPRESSWTPRYVVTALPDRFINKTSADSVETPDTGVSDTPVPETMVSEPNDPDNSDVVPAVISQKDADTLLTKSESAAVKTATDKGWEVRIGQRDDESYALTADYRANRVTLTITADKVTKVAVG